MKFDAIKASIIFYFALLHGKFVQSANFDRHVLILFTECHPQTLL